MVNEAEQGMRTGRTNKLERVGSGFLSIGALLVIVLIILVIRNLPHLVGLSNGLATVLEIFAILAAFIGR